jgi:hypothetical protein
MGHNKGVLRGQFIAMSACIKRTERAQINDLMLHLKLLKKQEQTNPKTRRGREITKIRAKINELVIQNTLKRIKKRKSWFFKKINKIDRTKRVLAT